MIITDSNPEAASGKEANPIANLSYPLNELLTKKTILKFVEYQRFTAADDPSDKTRAILSLPMPIQITENNQMKIDSFDGGLVSALANQSNKVIDGGGLLDMLGIDETGFWKNLTRAASLSPWHYSDNQKRQVETFTGVIKNPHTTAVFDGVQLRTFALTWKFSPRSEPESIELHKIINTIRERIHPKESQYALDYPDLVFVEFEGESKEFLPKFYRSFISAMTVNPSSGEGLAFYKDGAPINIELNLTFNEINIVTRNTIQGTSS